MNIGIDIDDTLTFLAERKKEICMRFINQKGWNYKIERTDSPRLKDIFGLDPDKPEHFQELWFGIYKELLDDAEAREMASEVTNWLKEQGHKIYIITARTDKWHENNAYNQSHTWLTKNNIAFDELLYGFEDKKQIALDKKLDLFIDDMPPTLTSIQEAGIQTIMIKNPHNIDKRIHNDTIAVSNWNEVKEYVQAMQKK